MVSIVIMHVSAERWYSTDIYTTEWHVYNFFYGINRWGVSIYLMISGTLFLAPDKNITIKALYCKYIKRLVIAYLIWSTLYTVKDWYCGNVHTTNEFLQQIIEGHYHMWYIPMMIGIYMVIPILKKLTEDKYILNYFMILIMIFNFMLSTIAFVPGCQGIYRVMDRLLVPLVSGYIGFFVLGYFLDGCTFEKKQRVCIYVLGILGAVVTFLITAKVSERQGTIFYDINGGFTCNVMLASAAVFVFLKTVVDRFRWGEKTAGVVRRVADCTFGGYLIHPFILEVLDKSGIETTFVSPIAFVLVTGMIVFALAILISLGLKRIPALNKYIV